MGQEAERWISSIGLSGLAGVKLFSQRLLKQMKNFPLLWISREKRGPYIKKFKIHEIVCAKLAGISPHEIFY